VTAAGGTRLRLFVFARHGESAANASHVLSTDPARPAALTERGRAQARVLSAQLANLPIDLAVCSRLPRARETVSIALGGRAVPVMIEPGFDEIRAGDLDGKPIEAYWDWLGQHPRGPAATRRKRRRRAAAFLGRAALAPGDGRNRRAGHHPRAGPAAHCRRSRPDQPPQPDTDFAHAVPYLFGEHALRHAAVGLAAPEDVPGADRTNGARGPHLAAAKLKDPFAPGK